MIPINQFYYDLTQLRTKYKLSYYYKNYIEMFLFFNKIKFHTPAGNLIMKTGKDENNEPFLYLQIFPETTINDIRSQWYAVEIQQEKLWGYKKGRFKVIKKIDRNKRIMELFSQGKNAKEIQKIINKEFCKETLGYGDILKIKSEFQKLIDEA